MVAMKSFFSKHSFDTPSSSTQQPIKSTRNTSYDFFSNLECESVLPFSKHIHISHKME